MFSVLKVPFQYLAAFGLAVLLVTFAWAINVCGQQPSEDNPPAQGQLPDIVRPNRPVERHFGLDPTGQAIVRGNEGYWDHERRLRRLERQMVEMQRSYYRNPNIPFPTYRDELPAPIPVPPPFPDGFPFGEAPPNSPSDK